MNDQKPKIIIDEDWKSQVEKEKEALLDQVADQTTSSDDADAADQMPLASFMSHVMSLATQATAALGKIPDPAQPDQEPKVHLGLTKYLIDTIVVLQQKAEGNLTPEEVIAIENIIHQLRLLYVEVSNQPSQKK